MGDNPLIRDLFYSNTKGKVWAFLVKRLERKLFINSSFWDVTKCRIKRLFNADLVGPRTLIVPIFLQPLLHSFSLSVKCTRKKSDLFRIWRSPLEIGFTTALSSYSQLFNTFRKNDSLAQNISDKGILLFVSFGNSSHRENRINWQQIVDLTRGKNIEAI